MIRSLHSWIAFLVTATFLAPLPIAYWLAAVEEPASGLRAFEWDWSLFWSTVAVAVAAGCLATLIGFLLAMLFTLTDFPAAALGSTIALLAFICPPAVWALGQLYCYGPGGLAERWLGSVWRVIAWGIPGAPYVATTIVLAQIHAPLAMLIIGRGLARLHHSGGESALALLSPRRFFVWLIGAARSELLAALLLVFALALGSFAVPHVLQCRLYAIDVYMRAANYLDHAAALAAAAPLLLAACLAAGLLACVERGGLAAGAPAGAPPRIQLGWRRWPAGLLLVVYLGATTCLPLAALVVECRSWREFMAAVGDADIEIANTIRVAAAAAAVASVAGWTVATGLRRSRWSRIAVRTLATAPLGVPSLIIGLAYLRFYNGLIPRGWSLFDYGAGLLVLGLAFRTWPFTVRLAALGQDRLATSWEEAARLASMPSLIRWWRIGLPLTLDHIAGGAIVAFVLAAGDIEITQLLCAPGQGTLALRLFTYLHFGPTHVAASLATLLILICAAPLAAYFVICQRCLKLI